MYEFSDYMLFVIILFSSQLIVHLVNIVVPAPFIDEIFHIGQLNHYCAGNFTHWDSKITTPPGLYVVTLFFVPILDSVYGILDVKSSCSLETVRYLNSFFTAALYLISVKLMQSLHENYCSSANLKNRAMMQLTALNVTIFPLSFFYTFLYYTDVLSLFLVSWTYLLAKLHYYNCSAFVGLLSCCVRQSNIVWVAFSAGCALLDQVEMIGKRNDIARPLELVSLNKVIGILWSDFGISKAVLRTLLSYILVGIGFVVFVFKNNGIALGDRQAHQLSFHLVQVCYCMVVFLVFNIAVLLPKLDIYGLLLFAKRRKMLFSLLVIGSTVSIALFTYAHPYLLADNRHLTFYIWRRWFMAHWSAKYLLMPVYFLSLTAVHRSLEMHSFCWKILFWLTLALVTVPNRLLELRYFIIPYYMWRIHAKVQCTKTLLFEFTYSMLINCACLILFFYKTFSWPDEQHLQRIIF
ncbi:Dol-P-Glc:Glc(2)Man(9)GlcNAc(2)-PP-Dol alpha-1,2-glucosyltransferase [Trichinella papuae]|uniref:Dol-P-Glc:Glc(2)Man(9)GlcNAc(2)-PP-Dol alpha-1,2-glucosyltransferase n=1 Tax=Trichinella papuae TaxID=268474 RepID=A0A0V1MZQ3_9BILA|nr:Dol-P-Glc:Glc(2)Man(9)GlcNAc(2)-PP-Dol alpha-1,2-glucosyltransferase [Trichinella papuae]